jgi:hypothetical protein
MASAPPHADAQSGGKKDISYIEYNEGITAILAATAYFALTSPTNPSSKPRDSNTEIRSGPLCTGSAPPLHPRSRRSWCKEQEVRQSGSLYAWCTYQVVINRTRGRQWTASCDLPSSISGLTPVVRIWTSEIGSPDTKTKVHR